MSERMLDNEVFEVWLVRERSKIQEGVASLVASIESQRGRNTNGRAARSMCRRVGGRGIFIVVGGVPAEQTQLPNCTAAPHPKLADRGKRGSEATLARINSRISA
jgi:hypothetical protein